MSIYGHLSDDKNEKEVINCKIYLPGSTRSSSLCRAKSQQARTVEAAAVAHAKPPGIKSPGVPVLVQKLLNAVKEWEMVEYPPSPPAYFNDEPRFPAMGTLLKEPWAPTPDSVGAFDTDWERASIRTLGEAIERSCQSHPRDRFDQLSNGSYHDLAGKVYDPVPFFPFSSVGGEEIRSMETRWYPVRNYHTGIEKLLPLRLSYLYGCEEHDVLDSIRTTNGTAMWTDETGAVFNGLCELIERDSFFIHYLSKKIPARVDRSILDAGIRDMIRYIERYDLEVQLLDISLEFNVPIVLCIILDRTGIGPAISIGTKCSTSTRDAVKSALLEAVQIRFFSRIIRLNSEGDIDSTNMDRRALSWYGVDNIEKLDFFMESRETSKPKDLKGTSASFLDGFDHDIFVSDVTLPRLNGLNVVKVNVPELLPLYFFDDHKPIYSERVQGYLSDVKLNEDPHPFL